MRLVHVTLHRPGHGVGHHGQVPGIYDEPELYEAACAYRDVPVEVAALLRVSNMTVYRLVHSGELEAIRVGRSFRVPEQAVNQYLRAAFVGTV